MHAPITRRLEGISIEIILLGSGVFGSLALSALSAVLPDIQAEYHAMPHAAYWTKAVVTVDGIAMAAAPFTGYAARALGGPRRTLIACYSVFLIAGIAGAFFSSLFAIIASRFIVGLAGATLITLALTLIGDRFEGRAREVRIGLNLALTSLLIGLLVPLAGWLGDHGGWRWAFGVHLLALPFLVFALLARDLKQFRRNRQASAATPSSLATILPIALLAGVAGSIALSVPIFLPFHVREIGISRAAIAGSLFTLMAGASVVSSASFGVIRRYLSATTIFVIAFSLWAIGLGLTGESRTLPIMVAGVLFIGSGGGLVQPCLFSTVAAMSKPASLARDNGLVKGFFYGGPLIGTTILQALLGHFPAAVSLLALGGVAVALALAALLVLAYLQSQSRRTA